MVSMKFYNDQLPTFNETQCKYRNLNLAYEWSDLKIPVLINDEIKYLFNRDAEFIQKMVNDFQKVCKENLTEMLIKVEKNMRKAKADKETSPDPVTPSTSRATTSAAPASEVLTSSSCPFIPRGGDGYIAMKASDMPGLPGCWESASSEQALADLCPRVFRRPHRSAQKRTKRCLAAAALAKAAVYSSTTSANGGVPSADNPSGGHPAPRIQNFTKLFGDLTLSPPLPNDFTEYCQSVLAESSVKPDTGENEAADVRREVTPDPPAWFGEVLDKFKNEVLQDVKNLVKDVLDTSLPTPSASDMKTVRVQNQDDDQYHYKVLDGSPSSSGGKHNHNEKHHHSSGSSKRKSGTLCSKRGGVVLGGAENKTTTPYSVSEKILEISGGLFVYSKSGFKVRMPRNASLTIQISIGKLSKYRTPLDDTDLRVQSVSNSIECCVKQATPAAIASKTAPTNKDLSVYYDVRIKSKDKSGKFRLYFNVISGGRIVGHSFKIDVRVKKEFTLPFGNSDSK